jgi:putative tricarboxylic transport membrane protein
LWQLDLELFKKNNPSSNFFSGYGRNSGFNKKGLAKLRKDELISSSFWFIVGIIICEESFRINLGELTNPGPGFLPFLSGLILGGIALLRMVIGFCRKCSEKEKIWQERSRLPKVGLTLGVIVIYGLLLESLGFLLTTFLILVILFKSIEPQRWRTALSGALFSAVGAYLVFQVWLKVELPTGFLGF